MKIKQKQNKWFFSLLLLAMLVIYSGCGGSSPTAGKPNIILISIDTLRQDHVAAYGYPKPTTPMLDQLATGGVLFEHAVSRSSWTLPAHMSILTGLPPSQHKVEERGMQLPDNVVTLAEILQEHGYNNGGFVTIPLLSQHYGFARGFATYELLTEQRGDKVTQRALNWLSTAVLMFTGLMNLPKNISGCSA